MTDNNNHAITPLNEEIWASLVKVTDAGRKLHGLPLRRRLLTISSSRHAALTFAYAGTLLMLLEDVACGGEATMDDVRKLAVMLEQPWTRLSAAQPKELTSVLLINCRATPAEDRKDSLSLGVQAVIALSLILRKIDKKLADFRDDFEQILRELAELE